MTPILQSISPSTSSSQATDKMAAANGSEVQDFFSLLGLNLETLSSSTVSLMADALSPGGAKTNTEEASAAAEETTQDPASLLALIGLIQGPPQPDLATNTVEGESTALADTLLAGKSQGFLSKNISQTAPLLSSQSTETDLTPSVGSTFTAKLQNNLAAIAGETAISAASIVSTPISHASENIGNESILASSVTTGAMLTSQQIQQGSSQKIETHLQNPQWGEAFSEKIVWSTHQKLQNAEITISPPDLGPISIKLELNGNELNASFASHTHEVRQAIEEAMPKLRQMLESSGITLGDSQVGAQLPQKQQESAYSQQQPPSRFQNETAILAGDITSSSTTALSLGKSGRGLVDLFA